MVIIKTDSEIERLRIGGPMTAAILRQVAAAVAVGVTTKSLDELAHRLVLEAGSKPAFLHYKPAGADRPFPATLCISVNDEVVHGIPSKRTLKNGDIVVLDLGVNYQGVFLDHAVTVGVGKVSVKDAELMAATEESLNLAIATIDHSGPRTVGDIGQAVQSYIKECRLTVVRDLSGHGVGRAIHEDPYIPNYGKQGRGEKLVPGMVIAIEPIISRGTEELVLHNDGYTLSTADGSHAAHFEHTVLITEEGVEVLTQ